MANIQNIELRRLRHVIEVGSAGSISVAAGSLGISQPALSRSIALLEHQIGIQLFERIRRGTRLTDEGELFVAEAKKNYRQRRRSNQQYRRLPQQKKRTIKDRSRTSRIPKIFVSSDTENGESLPRHSS